MLAAQPGANGASVTLQALADSIQAQLKGAPDDRGRTVEAVRGRPAGHGDHASITLVGVFVLSPAFFEPYRTPLGQGLLSALSGDVLRSLLLMRRKARPARAAAGPGRRGRDDARHLVLLAGMLLSRRPACLVVAFLPSAPRLDAALAQDRRRRQSGRRSMDTGPVGRPSERLGALLYRITPDPVVGRQRAALRLQDKSIAEFYADKAVMAIIGAILPGLVGLALSYLAGSVERVPALLGLLGAAIGFVVPDLLLRRSAGRPSPGRPRRCWSFSIWSPWSG